MNARSFAALLMTAWLSPAMAQDLVPFQWALHITDTTRGVCTSVPDGSGDCTRDSALPQPGVELGADAPVAARAPVLIGLIDTGIDYLHPELTQRVWLNPGEALDQDLDGNGRDDGCENGDDRDANGYVDDCHGINVLASPSLPSGQPNPDAGDPLDSSLGHGTHMAGLMVGFGEARGVAGDYPNIRIVTCKAAQMEEALALVPGTALPAVTEANARRCMDYFLDLHDRGEPLHVVNLSGGMSRFVNLVVTHALVKPEFLLDTPAMRETLSAIEQRDIVLVASAGNLAWDMDAVPSERAYFPAAFDSQHVISVTATDATGALWSGSSTGRYSVDVAAPGHHVLGPIPRPAISGDASAGLHTVTSGTSSSAALVSGTVAVLRAASPDMDGPAVRRLILAGGRPLPALQTTTLSGRVMRFQAGDGASVFDCQGQTVQRRVWPRGNRITLLPGDAMTLEVERFTCADIDPTPFDVTVSDGTRLTLRDDGLGADRRAGDGVFSARWTVPATAAERYTVTLPQGPQMADDTLVIDTVLVADNAGPGVSNTGSWWFTTLRSGYFGLNYQVAYTSSREQIFRWSLQASRSGRYELQVRAPSASAFASNALYGIVDATGALRETRVNQRINGGRWISLGVHDLAAGTVRISLSNRGADGTVAADAVRLVWRG